MVTIRYICLTLICGKNGRELPNINLLWLCPYDINTIFKSLYYDFLSIGVWTDSNNEVMYALANKITFICQMDFNAFPVDIQVRSHVTMHLRT